MRFRAFKYCARYYSSSPNLPKCDFIPNNYTGPSFEELVEIRRKLLKPALRTYYKNPLTIHQGYKQWLYDLEGRRYLDMFAGICSVSVGHCHPKISEALSEQIRKLGHVSNLYFHPKIHEYAERLSDKFPGDLKVVFFVNSGSEANDLAAILARAYTKRYNILTLQNSYHGMTYETMSLTSNSSYKHTVPQDSGVYNVMNPDVYRGLWGGSYCRDSLVQTSRKCNCTGLMCEAKDNYLKQFQEMLNYSVNKNYIAAFFAESIQGEGGIVQFPKGYLKEVHDRIKENGGLFVSDEVQTGFGRTGEHFWGFEMHGIQPDIVTVSRGSGNGFPSGAVITRPEIAQVCTNSPYFNTFGGNPLACAVGISVLDVIEEENLQENCNNTGNYLLKELEKLKYKHKIIGDVRGKGLMIGIELVENNEQVHPLSEDKFFEVWEGCRNFGLLLGRGGFYGNVLRIQPPMCITKEDVDFTVAVLDTVCEQMK